MTCLKWLLGLKYVLGLAMGRHVNTNHIRLPIYLYQKLMTSQIFWCNPFIALSLYSGHIILSQQGVLLIVQRGGKVMVWNKMRVHGAHTGGLHF